MDATQETDQIYSYIFLHTWFTAFFAKSFDLFEKTHSFMLSLTSHPSLLTLNIILTLF